MRPNWLKIVTPARKKLHFNFFSVLLVCALLSRVILFRVYLTSLQLILLPCGGRKTPSHTYYSVVYIFWSFVIIESIPGILKIYIKATN